MSGRRSTVATNLSLVSSLADVGTSCTSISGWAIGRIFFSSSALEYSSGTPLFTASPATAAKPMRWSMILPGTWPLRKPGTVTCLAISLRAASRYGLNSSGSTVMVSFTLVGSRFLTLIFTLALL